MGCKLFLCFRQKSKYKRKQSHMNNCNQVQLGITNINLMDAIQQPHRLDTPKNTKLSLKKTDSLPSKKFRKKGNLQTQNNNVRNLDDSRNNLITNIEEKLEVCDKKNLLLSVQEQLLKQGNVLRIHEKNLKNPSQKIQKEILLNELKLQSITIVQDNSGKQKQIMSANNNLYEKQKDISGIKKQKSGIKIKNFHSNQKKNSFQIKKIKQGQQSININCQNQQNQINNLIENKNEQKSKLNNMDQYRQKLLEYKLKCIKLLDEYGDYLLKNTPKIIKLAQFFGIPIQPIAFNCLIQNISTFVERNNKQLLFQLFLKNLEAVIKYFLNQYHQNLLSNKLMEMLPVPQQKDFEYMMNIIFNLFNTKLENQDKIKAFWDDTFSALDQIFT